MFNFSNLSNPTYQSFPVPLNGLINRLVVSGNTAYLADGSEGLGVVSLSNPAAPVNLGTYVPSAGVAYDVKAVGTNAYVAAQGNLQTFDVSNPAGLVASGDLAFPNIRHLDVANNHAFLAGSGAGLGIADISSPSSPQLIATASNSTGSPTDVAVAGGLAYTSGFTPTSGAGFDVFDVSNPGSPQHDGNLVTNAATGNEGYGVTINGSLALVAESGGTLRIIDVSNATSPTLIASAATAGEAWSVAASADGHYAFVAGSNFVQIFDISNPSSPVAVSTYPISGVGFGVAVANGLLYVAGGADGVLVLDPTNPAAPQLIASYKSAWGAFDVSVVGSNVYVADGEGGIDVLTLQDLQPPSVAITSSSSGSAYSTSTGTINLSGSASDNVGVTQVTWSNSDGGSGTATGTASWSAHAIPLQAGVNVLTVTAIDAAGNQGTAVLNVTYTPVQSSQTITFSAVAAHTFGDPPFALNAIANSGLPVSFSVVSGPATLLDNTLAITGAGTVVVSATQAGNAFFSAAAPVSQSFAVNEASQAIALATPSGLTFGSAPFAETATADSGLQVSLSVVSGPATVTGNLVTLTGAGGVVLQGSQGGDANYNAAANQTVSFNVAQAPQTISFGTLSNQHVGDAPFLVTATTSSGLAPTFSLVSGPATVSGGVVTITGPGTVILAAAQSGNTNYLPATSVNRSFTSLPAPVVTTLTKSSTTTLKFGQSVTFTAAVSSGAGTPTGSVTFKDGAAVLGTGRLSGGTATFTTASMAVGSHSITAVYSGDVNFVASTSHSLTQTVSQSTTTTKLSKNSTAAIRFGQSVTFTATLAAVGPGAGTPTGAVTFLEGATVLGVSPLVNGVATFTTATLAAGSNSIKATYGGDTNFAGSTSGAIAQTVTQSGTTTTLTKNTTTAIKYGQSVTFTATLAAVSPGAGVPTGAVTFMDGAGVLGSAALVNGVATFTTATLPAGSNAIKARYGGDANFTASTSGSLTQTAQPITYEAEKAVLGNGTVAAQDNIGYTGSGYADFGAKNSTVQFTVNAFAAGTATLSFRYANGTTAVRPVSVTINGTLVGSIAFSPTGAWTTWATTALNAALLAGSNTILLTVTGVAGPNLDSLAVSPVPPLIYEGESAVLGGGTVAAVDNAGYTGAGYADFGHKNSTAQFNVVTSAAGAAFLTFRYANGSTAARPVSLSVNGTVVSTLSFAPTGSWTNWTTTTLSTPLLSGSNVILLTVTGSDGPNLDSLTVS